MIDSTPVLPNDPSPTLIRFAPLLVVIVLLAPACAGDGVRPDPTDEPPWVVVGPRLPNDAEAAPSASADDGAETPANDPSDTRATGAGNADAETPEVGNASATETQADAATTEEGAGEPQDADDAGPDEEEEEEAPPRRRVVLDTEYDDARVGNEETPLIEAEMGLVQDERLNAYVKSVALRLLRHAPTRPFDYEFKIVDQSVPNAFALPGGKIYVSRGLLALMTSEDELAGVLGHEITHAAERHASARLEYAKRLNPFTIGLLRVGRIAAYGRDQERDADRGGQILAARAGYDPAAIAEFLRKLDASERYVVGWSRLPSFFATHPTSPERAAIALDRAHNMEWTATEGVASDAAGGYYGVIDGLVIGDDPAGGLFDAENKFVHPELRFSLRFPPGWDTLNASQQVLAASPRRDAQAELSLIGPADRPLDTIVDEFLAKAFQGVTVRVRDRRTIKIGELDAIRIEGRAVTPGGSVNTNLTFVAYDGLVYRLQVLSLDAARYRGRARAFAGSFRPIDEETARSLRVTRLRVARALEDETLQQLSERTRNELEVVFTGVLNGIYASTPLPQRTPVKIGIAEPYLPRAAREGEDENGEETDASAADVEAGDAR
ncbi:MAG: M48 family metalloprotease [Myxococcota bacterium]